MPSVYIGIGPGPTEAEWMAETAATAAAETNGLTIEAAALLALSANTTDVTQNATVRATADGIANNAATNLTTQQIVGVLKQLAQGISILAAHDDNTKKELQALVRLVLGQLDSTGGT